MGFDPLYGLYSIATFTSYLAGLAIPPILVVTCTVLYRAKPLIDEKEYDATYL